MEPTVALKAECDGQLGREFHEAIPTRIFWVYLLAFFISETATEDLIIHIVNNYTMVFLEQGCLFGLTIGSSVFSSHHQTPICYHNENLFEHLSHSKEIF